MNNAQVGRAFNAIVQTLGRDRLAGLLMNWNDSELNEDGDKIIGFPGRDRHFSTGKEGGSITVPKSELLAWLASDGPFDPKEYGPNIRSDAQWCQLIADARTAAGIAAPGTQTVPQDEQGPDATPPAP